MNNHLGNALMHISMHDMLSIPWNKITLCYIVLCTIPGAYEPLKATKKHETEFHNNPNYITVFVLPDLQMKLQLHEVEMSSLSLKKRKTSRRTQSTLPLPCITGHVQFCIQLQINGILLFLYGK